MTLFEINEKIMRFEWEIDPDTGEILNCKDLDALRLAKQEKIENIGLYIKNLKAERVAVKAEADAMADRAKKLGKKIESLESYLTYALEGTGFSTPRVAITFRPSESIEIEAGAKVPEQYMRTKPAVTEPDKVALKKAIKDGEEFEGIRLIKKINPTVK